VSTGAVDYKLVAQEALNNPDKLAELIEMLATGSRRGRQNAASIISLVAQEDASVLEPYSKELTDALNRPEAQTRWECLDALTLLVDVNSRLCDKAIDGAETALFDEESGPVRLSAMRFLCKLGATTEARSEKTWPLIDEGIQCYHGDIEFSDMLVALLEFSKGKLTDQVKSELANRMAFDAQNGHGALKHRANQIIENVS
jgi:hypothetical protein